MRAYTVGLSLIVIVAAPVAYAADVEYNVSITDVSEFTEQTLSKPFSEVVKDRVWAASGIEERDSSNSATCCLSDRGPRIVHEFRQQYWHVSYSLPESETRAPDWIDDVLWPRTKEVLHYTSEPRPEPKMTEVVLFLGPPVRRNTFAIEAGAR